MKLGRRALLGIVASVAVLAAVAILGGPAGIIPGTNIPVGFCCASIFVALIPLTMQEGEVR